MKTSVTMIRKMGSFNVLQRTKDGMFNATSLLKQWNKLKNTNKKLDHYFDNKATQEFIDAIVEDSEFLHARNSVYVKSRASRGINAGTWMHPYLFIDFSLWINPKFKLEVIKFVYDELIKQRNNAGDNYILLSSSGVKLKGYNFKEVAIAMQYIIFGKKGKNLRQTATQQQLKELSQLQTKLSFAIDMGYITSYAQLISEMRKIYNKKFNQIFKKVN